jgi:hypothetical protein
MTKKMTISELRNLIQERAMNMYADYLWEGKYKKPSKELDEDYGEQLNSVNCMENPEVCMSKPETITDPRGEI